MAMTVQSHPFDTAQRAQRLSLETPPRAVRRDDDTRISLREMEVFTKKLAKGGAPVRQLPPGKLT